MKTQRSSMHWNRPFTLKEVIINAIHFRPITTRGRKLFQAYGESIDRCREVYREMQHISLKFLLFDIDYNGPPEVLGFDGGSETRDQMEANLDEFAENLAASWNHPRVGRIEWQGPKECVVTYCDMSRRHGFLTDQISVVRQTHRIVDAKYHKLPALHVEQPRRAEQVGRTLNYLLPHARIITGMLVGQASDHVEDIDQRNALGRGVDRAVAIGKSRAAQVAALGTLAALAATALGSAALAAASAIDPVLIVGDRVLVGWE